MTDSAPTVCEPIAESAPTVRGARKPPKITDLPASLLSKCSTFYPPAYDSYLYFLVRGEEIVYIGETVNVFSRVADHWRNGKLFDYAAYVPVPLDKYSRRDLEKYFITWLKPKFNDKRLFGWRHWSRARQVKSLLAAWGCQVLQPK